MIYFDQAASSFPKPPEVGEAMLHALNEIGANPGRGSHMLAREAAAIISETRERAANVFGCGNPKKSIFFQNATGALNQAIKGLPWNKGDHIIASTFEHNSIRRPLEYLKRTDGIEVTYVTWNENETDFLNELKQTIQPNTKLIAMTHASNVTGSIIPIDKVCKVAIEDGVLTLIDASQTAGHIPLHMEEMGIGMLAFPGHKGLHGPQGIGMLLVQDNIELEALFQGGTGTFSEEPEQPLQWPEKLESGTLNTPGIAGLNAAMAVYEKIEKENVPRETILTNKLLQGLKQMNGITCYGPGQDEIRMPIVAFNVLDIPSQEIALVLDAHYQIAVRAGLHCSPLAHETLHTMQQGVVRASLSRYNTEEEVDTFLRAIEEIVTAYNLL